MSQLADYCDRYRCLRMSREGGVLHIALHTRGGPFAFCAVGGTAEGGLATALKTLARRRTLPVQRDASFRLGWLLQLPVIRSAQLPGHADARSQQ
jgi:hypothetical protein